MSMIHVNRDRQNLGQFSPGEIAEGLRSNRFLPTDLAWREGMDGWQPLSTFTDLPAAEPVETFAPPMEAAPATAASEIPFPWENRAKIGTFTALFETLSQTLGKPGDAFRRLGPQSSLLGPYAFYLLIAMPAFAVYFAELLVFINYTITSIASNAELASKPETAQALTVLKSVGPLWFSFLLLIVVPSVPLFAAGVYHLLLMLLGGARDSFMKTFAVTCYVFGSTSPMIMLPCCGPVAMVIWGLVSMSIGLGAAHRTDTWRATLAVTVPFLFCCGGYMALNIVSAMAHMQGATLHP